jgi:hypothetical protein
MILVIVIQEVGPVAWWPKTLKGELENNTRQPRGLANKRESYSLK